MSALSGTLSTDAIVARDAFRGMMETLSNSENYIHRATRLAFYCAKNGMATEVIELIIQTMENELSWNRRVELVYVVDSITQFSQRHKDTAEACFIPIIETQLSRLLLAAAPHWVGAREKQRQIVKVLRLWIKRKIFAESTYLQHFVNNLELCSKNLSPADRDVDGRAKEIDGMLVEECDSNVTLLPGHFKHPHVLVQEEELQMTSLDQDLGMEDLKDKEVFSKEGKGSHGIYRTDEGGSQTLSSQPSPPDNPPLSTFLSSPIKPQLQTIFPPSPLSLRKFSPPSPPDSPPQVPPLPSSPPPLVPPRPPPSDDAIVRLSHPTMPNLSYPPPHGYGQGYKTMKPPVSIPPPSLPGPSSDFTYLNTVVERPPLEYRMHAHEPLPNSIVLQQPNISGPWPPLERQLTSIAAFQPLCVSQRPPAPSDGFQTSSFSNAAPRPPTPGKSWGQPMMWYGQHPTSHGYSKPA